MPRLDSPVVSSHVADRLLPRGRCGTVSKRKVVAEPALKGIHESLRRFTPGTVSNGPAR